MTVENMPNRGRKRRRSAGNAFVLLAITLVSAAAGLGFHLQAGMPQSNAILAALVVWVGLVCLHVLVRRSDSIRELTYEIDRLEGELTRLVRGAGAPRLDPQLQASPVPAPRLAAAASTPVQPGSQFVPRSAGPQKLDVSQYWSIRPTDVVRGAPPAPPAPPGPASTTVERSPIAAATSSPEAIKPSPDVGSEKASSTPASVAATSPDPNEPPAEAEVEQISKMIRKFAEEISQPRKTSEEAPAEDLQEENEAVAAMSQEDAISASVGALRAVADEMRKPSEFALTAIEKGQLPLYCKDPDAKGPQPPALRPEHTEMAAMAATLAAHKLDVFLEPIVGLEDRKARHFEVSLRLRQGSSEGLGARDYVPMARKAGLLPVIDSTRIARAAMVARHMDERQTNGSLFATVTADSLADERFLNEFAQAFCQVPCLRERLVMVITQAELGELSDAQWSTIRQFSGTGFRFAVDEVTSLDLDLSDLHSSGFAFVRLAAQSMSDGLSGLDGVVSAADACKRLADAKMTVIAVGLGSEEQLEQLRTAGVTLGQGALFGVPRAIRAEALQPAKSAA